MSIVLELQAQAIDSNSDILSLLRKALLVARKLGLKDFGNWVNAELEGYDESTEIPNYRKVYGQLKFHNPYHGWRPIVMEETKYADILTNRKVNQSIPGIISLLNNKDGIFCMSIPDLATTEICAQLPVPMDCKVIISLSQMINIIEQVKTKILDWTLLLEENGIVGEGLSFSAEEKMKAQQEPQIVNYISNFYGDVNHSQVQQGTSSSTQER